MYYYNTNLHINMLQITVCMVLLSTLGAVLDTALSITSSLYEVILHKPDMSRREIYHSGLQIGKDIIGTTVNTLFFAYLGDSLLLFFYLKNVKYTAEVILNSKMLFQGVSAMLFSAIACLLTVPVASAGCIAFSEKRGEEGRKIRNFFQTRVYGQNSGKSIITLKQRKTRKVKENFVMLVPKYYEDLEIMHENTMPYRAYYIPASCNMGPLVEDRFSSDRTICLNGTWKFQYFESLYDLQDRFYEPGFDLDRFREVEVPGNWQNYGYDSHQYTNVRYPIPLDPPYVPGNPCGAYVYKFDYKKQADAPRAYLNFEGVDSCFYVWINGKYVGYSQVSHATSEFDVTDVLLNGENTLAVLV